MVKSTYCIIGATGFLGRHLLRHLATNPIRSVRCLSRKTQAPTEPMAIEWLTGDLHDERALQSLISKDTIVINLGYDSSATRDANVIAARTLGRVCVAAQAQRLVHISTATVVGRTRDNLICESTRCAPHSEYEQTKLDIEDALLSETKDTLATTVIRPVAVFGEGGQNLVQLARRVADSNFVSRQFLACLHGMRRMNLVASENVVAAIAYLANATSDISQGLFIVSDDDSANNNYAYVESRLALAFGKAAHPSMTFSLPAPLLSLLLRTRGRSNVNPYRRYSCDRLLNAGFTHPAQFETALDAYAAHLAAQWARLHRISG